MKSVKLLCYQKRKVFFGNNLFAAGACGAGAEKLINKRLKGYRYLGSSLVLKDVGMEMRVMGRLPIILFWRQEITGMKAEPAAS